MRRVLCLLALFVGCRTPAEEPDTGCGGRIEDPLAEIEVRSARLEELMMWQGGLGVGHAEGDARLVIIDTEGQRHSFFARLDGHHLGLTADLSTYFGGTRHDFELPADSVVAPRARDLLGEYSGLHVGLTVVAGGHFRALENVSGIRVNLSGISLGLGAVPASWESLELALWNDPARVVFADEEEDLDDEDDFDDLCLFEDEACDVDWSDCCSGVCVPLSPDGSSGVCRPSCGFISEDEQGVARANKSQQDCDDDESCEAITALPDLELAAVACMPADALLHEPCAAAFDVENDEDACIGALDCQPAGEAYDWDGARTGYAALRCKKPCDPGGSADELAYCTDFGELCMQVPATVGYGAPLFACATPVPTYSAVARAQMGASFDGNYECDDIGASRFCDGSAFFGVSADDAGFTTCVRGAVATGSPAAGVCIAVCSIPATDLDGDGVITPGVDIEAFEGACASGWSCTTALATEVNLGIEVGACEPTG